MFAESVGELVKIRTGQWPLHFWGSERDSQLPTGSSLRGPASILLYPSAPAPDSLTLGNLDVQGSAD